MNVEMTREKFDTIVFMFTMGSFTVGFLSAYLLSRFSPPKRIKAPRRTPAQRHTRKHG